MRNKLTSDLYKFKATRSAEEKIALMQGLQLELINHFYNKATRSKRFYQIYKYASIVLAALTSIISSLQVIYSSSFPQWILPVASAGATIAVAFLGASGAQKYGSTPEQRSKVFKPSSFYLIKTPVCTVIYLQKNVLKSLQNE